MTKNAKDLITGLATYACFMVVFVVMLMEATS